MRLAEASAAPLRVPARSSAATGSAVDACWVASPIHAAGLCRSRCSVVAPSGSTQGPHAAARAANAWPSLGTPLVFAALACRY
jgi:hypothetical protein